VLRAWAAAAGAAPLSAERTAALDALVTAWHGQGPVNLPGGVGVRRASGTLEAYPAPPETVHRSDVSERSERTIGRGPGRRPERSGG
jgi:tRNA(Ile)-lysidine synthase